MRIGYDAKRAFLNNTGLGNYSRWLISTTARQYPDDQFIAYTPKLKPNKWRNIFGGLSNISTVTPAAKFLTSLWRSKGIVKDLQRDGIEVYHGLSHELPMGIGHSGVKSVVTIHDLIFLRFPQYYSSINRFIYTSKIKYACRTADKVIAISERTRQDLIDLLQIDANKIEVVYQNCAPEFNERLPAERLASAKAKYNLPDQFILNVGTIEPRKNLMLLVNAIARLAEPVPVIVVGKPTRYLDEVKHFINANGIEKHVTFLHQVEFEDLPAIYQLADLFVYPSRYEGFGIPILEALRSGVPVIAAKGSSLEEAGGPLSRYVDPDDDKDLAGQIEFVLKDRELHSHMTKKGLIYAERFKDTTLAPQLMYIYTQLTIHA